MNLQNGGNPNEHIDLQEEVQRGFDETGKHPARIHRYSLAHERALVNVTHIAKKIESGDCSSKLKKVYSRLSNCGHYLQFRDFYTIGKIKLHQASFCDHHLLCPLCAIRRGSKNLTAYLERFRAIMAENPKLKLSMLTLTVKNGEDLNERFSHLQNSVVKFLERRRKTIAKARGWNSEFGKILGLVGTYEVTKDGGIGDVKETGWHPHAHLMILHEEFFDYSALQAEWLAITGDSHVLRVDAAHRPDDPAEDFLEIFKYAVKFSDLSPEENLDAYEVLAGRRLLFSAGLFRGVKVSKSLLDEKEPLDGLPFIDKLYRFFVQSGYNLTETVEGISEPKPEKPIKPKGRIRSHKDGFSWRPDEG